MFLILSIDGGGCKGLIAAEIIKHIALQNNNFFDAIDCIIGVSSGSIIGAMVAAGLEPESIEKLFEKQMEHVFKKKKCQSCGTFWGLRKPKYSNRKLWNSINCHTKGMKIGDLQKRFICYSYDAKLRNPLIYVNKVNDVGKQQSSRDIICDDETPLTDIIYQSCLAPTYFRDMDGVMDGGMISNNPSMIATSIAHKCYGIPMHEIQVISIGTKEIIRPALKSFNGVRFWIKHGIYLLMDTSLDHVELTCRCLLNDNYFRIEIPCNLPIDCWKKNKILKEIGYKMYVTFAQEIKNIFNN